MKKYKKLWIGAISVGLALLIFMALLLVQQSAKKGPVYEEVLCAKRVIEQSVVITEQNISQYVEWKMIPVEYLPDAYIKAPAKLYGKMFCGTVSKGSILTESMCVEYLKEYQQYKCLTWISIPVKELYEGVAGSLQKGDYIDIYTLWKEGENICTQLLAEHVRIMETFTSQGVRIEEGEEGLSQLLVVPVEKDQVPMYYEMLAKGSVRVAKYGEG